MYSISIWHVNKSNKKAVQYKNILTSFPESFSSWMHLSSLVAKTCQRLQLIFEEDPVYHNHSKYSINRFYPIFVEQPTISSPFVPLSLTMTINLLPLTLSRPWPPLQLSFEEDPVTHNPSSSFPYFRTLNGVRIRIMKANSWEGFHSFHLCEKNAVHRQVAFFC